MFEIVDCDLTVGHELGHFLMTHHAPKTNAGFTCSRGDMRRARLAEMTPAMRMEVEAQEFSALLLMPPPMWRRAMNGLGDPDLGQVTALARVSKEAAARSYAQYHDAPVAIVVAKDGHLQRAYRNLSSFPKLSVAAGDPTPFSSVFHRLPKTLGQMASCRACRIGPHTRDGLHR